MIGALACAMAGVNFTGAGSIQYLGYLLYILDGAIGRYVFYHTYHMKAPNNVFYRLVGEGLPDGSQDVHNPIVATAAKNDQIFLFLNNNK